MGYKFDHQANRKVIRELKGMSRRAQDVSVIWPRVGSYLSRQVRRQWATRGVHFGDKWAPLKPRTRREKAKLGFPRIPIVRKGTVRESLVGRPMKVEKKFPQSAIFGTDLDVAMWQQDGTFRNGKRAIPPRTLLKVIPEHRQYVKDLIRKRVYGRRFGDA